MLYFVMNAVGFVLLAMVALHSIVLHVRLHRLRHALPDAGRVLPSLDASVSRMWRLPRGSPSGCRTICRRWRSVWLRRAGCRRSWRPPTVPPRKQPARWTGCSASTAGWRASGLLPFRVSWPSRRASPSGPAWRRDEGP